MKCKSILKLLVKQIKMGDGGFFTENLKTNPNVFQVI